MNLSFHLVVDLEGLHNVTMKNPYGDLTRLFRISDKKHPVVDWLFLKNFFDRLGTLAIACENEVIVGKALMFCEKKEDGVYVSIERIIVSPPREGVLGRLIFELVAYAKPVAVQIDIMRVPGIYRTIRIKQST